jgi:hypothetical protein
MTVGRTGEALPRRMNRHAHRWRGADALSNSSDAGFSSSCYAALREVLIAPFN